MSDRILSEETVNALQQEAENAPDRPGIAHWGSSAVKSLVASHRLLAARVKELETEKANMGDIYTDD